MDNHDLKRGDLVRFKFSPTALKYGHTWSVIVHCITIPATAAEMWRSGFERNKTSAELEGHIAEILDPDHAYVYIPALKLFTAGIHDYVPLETYTTNS